MRLLAWLLLAYAGIGALLVVAALAVGGPLIARADRLAASASGSMDAAAAAASAAADSLTGFDTSLVEARRSTDQAATLSGDAARTFDSVADAMSLSVLGTQPLLSLADDFRTTAGQMRDLDDSLGGIGQALGSNQADLATVRAQLDRLAHEMGDFRLGVAQEQGGASPPLSWLFYGFLAWQLLPIGAAAIGGRLLLARAGRGTE
jgi:hypothetical protein